MEANDPEIDAFESRLKDNGLHFELGRRFWGSQSAIWVRTPTLISSGGIRYFERSVFVLRAELGWTAVTLLSYSTPVWYRDAGTLDELAAQLVDVLSGRPLGPAWRMEAR